MPPSRAILPSVAGATLVALLVALLVACGGGGGGGGGGTTPPPTTLFRDVTSTHLPATVRDQQCMDSVALDFDGDGDLDLALALEFRRNALLQNDGSGRFTDVSATVGMLGIADDHEDLTAADLDGDGDLDLAFAGEDTAVHEVYLDLGAVFSGSQLAQSMVANVVIAFDLEQDGDRDLLFGGQGLLLMVNDGAAGFSAAPLGRLPNAAGVVQDLVALDLDRDGDLDLALGVEGQNQVFVNDGMGNYSDATATLLPPFVDETRLMAFGDVDRDGDQDLYVGNVLQELPGGAGQNVLYLNDGTGVLQAAPPDRVPAHFSTYGGGFVDFDADGDPDLALANANLLVGADLDGFMLWRNDGTGRFTDISALAFGPTVAEHFMAFSAGDFDRDGKLDLFLCARGTSFAGAPVGFTDRLMLQN